MEVAVWVWIPQRWLRTVRAISAIRTDRGDLSVGTATRAINFDWFITHQNEAIAKDQFIVNNDLASGRIVVHEKYNDDYANDHADQNKNWNGCQNTAEAAGIRVVR